MAALTWPTSIQPPKEMQFFLWRISVVNDGEAGPGGGFYQRERRSRWRCVATWNNVVADVGQQLDALEAQLAEGYQAIRLPLWHYRAQLGSGVALQVSGAAGDKTVSISLSSGDLQAGDMFEIAGQVYIVVVGGTTSLTIEPGLRRVESNTPAVLITDGGGTKLVQEMRLVGTAQGGAAFPAPMPGIRHERTWELIEDRRFV